MQVRLDERAAARGRDEEPRRVQDDAQRPQPRRREHESGLEREPLPHCEKRGARNHNRCGKAKAERANSEQEQPWAAGGALELERERARCGRQRIGDRA